MNRVSTSARKKQLRLCCKQHRAAMLGLLAMTLVLQACASASTTTANTNNFSSKSSPAVNPFSITAKADSAYQRGDWITAARYYEELARAVPNDAFAWNRLGNIRLRQNNFLGAISAYEKALERDASSARTHYNLATAHLLIARRALESAHGLLPENDGGSQLIERKLGYFDEMVYQSIVEVPSPNEGLISP